MPRATRSELAKVVEHVEVTPAQHSKFLELLTANPAMGNVAALRQAGVAGTAGQLREHLERTEIELEAREARGHIIEAVEDVDWQIALDKDHQHGDRSRSRLLKAYGGARFRERFDVEHAGSVEVNNPDVAAAIERFTALAARAIREASGERTGDLPQLTQ